MMNIVRKYVTVSLFGILEFGVFVYTYKATVSKT